MSKINLLDLGVGLFITCVLFFTIAACGEPVMESTPTTDMIVNIWLGMFGLSLICMLLGVIINIFKK